MNFKALLDKAIEYIRKLPVAKMIRPIWQGALKALVQKKGDELQYKLREQIAAVGMKAIDRNVDKWQRDVIAGIKALPLPDGIEAKLKAIVQDHGDRLQNKLHDAVGLYGPAGVDAAFDAAQKVLIGRIEKL